MNRRELLQAAALMGLATMGRGAPPARAGQAAPAPAEAPGAGAGAGTLWLNWNENPLGLAPAALEAATSALGRGHRYPDAEREGLIEDLARRHGVEPRQVVLGCGSTELLQMIVQAFAAPGAALVLAHPTFEAMTRYQRPHGFRMAQVELDARHAHDLGRMREEAEKGGGPAVVYVCNPNNPTATLTPTAELDAWIGEAPERVLFAVDEAYHDYVEAPGYRSAARWVGRRPNVIVTRTFSKLYAMAGLRLGYALAHPATADRVRAFMSRDNANAVVLAAARAALADRGLIERSRAVNRGSVKITTGCLDELGLAYLPCHANFLMHRVPGELETYIGRMREAGVRVGRPFSPLTGYNRLSLGLPEEMARFSEILRGFRRRGWV